MCLDQRAWEDGYSLFAYWAHKRGRAKGTFGVIGVLTSAFAFVLRTVFLEHFHVQGSLIKRPTDVGTIQLEMEGSMLIVSLCHALSWMATAG